MGDHNHFIICKYGKVLTNSLTICRNGNLLINSGNGPGIVRFDNKDDSKQLELGRIVEDSTVHSSIYDALKMKDYKNAILFYEKCI